MNTNNKRIQLSLWLMIAQVHFPGCSNGAACIRIFRSFTNGHVWLEDGLERTLPQISKKGNYVT